MGCVPTPLLGFPWMMHFSLMSTPSLHPNPQPTATCLLVKAFVPQPKFLHPLTGEL